jgi:hypothetical protein
MLLTSSEISRDQPIDSRFCLRTQPKDRVEILIEWMGRSLRAEASVADLAPLSSPRC